MKKNYISNLLLILVIVALSSCSAYQKTIYFQGLDRNSNINHKIDNMAPLTVQIGDILAINVRSLNPDASAIFNTEAVSTTAAGSAGSAGGNAAPTGYVVDQNGDIELPLIHKVKVLGMTIPDIENTLQKDVLPYAKEPVVNVHLMNFKITVIGDVGSPSTVTVTSDHISIPQALSMAGDITITGKLDNILLVREINGERKYVNIDMTSDKLFESPYFYLKNNDMLYVQAGRAKFSANSPLKQNLPIILSFISLLLIAFEVYKKY